jgi:hypothetical protein
MTVPKQRRPETGAADSGFDYSLEGAPSTSLLMAARKDVGADPGLRSRQALRRHDGKYDEVALEA